ncbi:zinc finger, C3HC4 type family protein [Tasmannia lanceolata]|uniref:zinc finger, C3HC4 type family protein n=1 Tax=Tasmannia lanceolata TaxID=3420 RepID=UPI0040631674
MISVVAQERLLGAALGCVFTGLIVFEERKSIYSLISSNQRPQEREPIFRKSTRSDFVHLWNKAVDGTLGPVIASLSSRGW